MRYLCIFILSFFLISWAVSQDAAIYRQYPNQFWNKISEEIEKFEKKADKTDKQLRVNFDGKEYPTKLELYKVAWHNPSISQGNSGTCWAFSTISFYESEIYRLSGKQVKLSEMYTAYWEAVEKARRFVQQRGESVFDEGSQSNAIHYIWEKYGIVPAEAYTGMKPGQVFINHSVMFDEMKKYLQAIKAANCWNEEQVLSTIQAILNYHIGKPPASIVIDGKTLTPKEYLATLPINFNDYVDLMSLAEDPYSGRCYYELIEYRVPDNWRHSKEYFNIPLDDFMSVLRNAMKNGFTLCLGGDVTEPGYDSGKKVAIVPSFDIPSNAINEQARLFRFANGTTTDDHGIHCVGYAEIDNQNWYAIKDSGSGSRNVEPRGYYFYHEDYIKLKMMNILVHKDSCPEVWAKYQKACGNE